MNQTRKPIVVVGSINMDLVARTPRIPLAGQTLIGSGFTTTPGGKGANQAVAVARLGYPVQMVGAGRRRRLRPGAARQSRRRRRRTLPPSPRVSGPSGVAPIFVADSGENSIVVVSGRERQSRSRYHRPAQSTLIRSAGMVLCQLELPMGTIDHTLRSARMRRTRDARSRSGCRASARIVWSRLHGSPPTKRKPHSISARFDPSPNRAAQELLDARSARRSAQARCRRSLCCDR